MLSAINIKTRLILLLVAVGLIPLTVVSLVLLDRAKTALSDQAFDHLESISHTKKIQLERYIERIRADITVLAGSTHLADAIDAFASVVDNGEIDRVEYDYFESLEYGSSFRKFIGEYGYYDLMLITSDGDIVYSTLQESDLAQNVRSGALAETLLGQAFEQGLQKITVTDFQLYAPSNGRLMAFLLAPVQLRGEETLGAVVLKMPHEQINRIMLERVGMGESSEAYLVGPDRVMRSDAYLDPKHRKVLAAFLNPEQGRVETTSTREALAGRSGKLIQDDYRGVSVLSSYTPVEWGDITYALTAEEDASEAFGPIAEKIALIEKQKEELNLANEGLEDLVTQRTAALKESQERFALAIAATKLGLWDWQPHIGEVTISDGWAEILGYSKDDISGSDSEWSDRLHPEDKERALADYQRHVDNRTELYRSEFHFTARFGIGAETSHRESRALPEDLQDLRVLVVDDNPTSRTILVRYLESFGFQCNATTGGEQALVELEAADPPYKLVLMDWKMPGMDGIETTRRIRADEKLATVPQVLMVSAYGREELREAAQDAGIQVYLVKPVNPSTLLDATLEAVGHQVRRRLHNQQGNLAADHVRGAHLLLVEDNEINQQVATELLEQAGLEVTIAHHGQEALDMLGAGDDIFDGVLMDIQMPVMDGYTAAREIRKDPRFKRLPVIAMTANAMAQDREQALKAGMNDHVAKPIDVKDLFEVLGRWIDVPEERRAGPGGDNDSSRDMATAPGTAIPELDGIDAEGGLKRMGGNKALFLKILRKFRDSQNDAVNRMQSAVRAEDTDRAGREAHTLKGLAGNVGAQSLYQSAERVERLFRSGESGDSLDTGLAELQAELTRVVVSLNLLPAGDAANALDKPVDITRVGELLAQLRALLEDDDADATDIVDELTPLMASSDHARHLARLAVRVDEYDYDEALELLEEIERAI